MRNIKLNHSNAMSDLEGPTITFYCTNGHTSSQSIETLCQERNTTAGPNLDVSDYADLSPCTTGIIITIVS